MTPEAQRIAIAEACGWTEITFTGMSYEGIIPKDVSPRPSPGPDAKDTRAWYWLPDYLNDLNAMHRCECILLANAHAPAYSIALRDVLTEASFTGDTTPTFFEFAHATAAQRAEAFLRTIGKW